MSNSDGGYTLGQTLRLTFVPRWVIVPMVRPQSVAEHSWRVAIIVQGLAGMLGFSQEAVDRAVVHANLHDVDECQTGDIPSTAKDHTGVDYLTWTDEDLVVKAADLLESYWWVWAWAHSSVPPEIAQSVLDAFTPVEAAMKARWGKDAVQTALESLGDSMREMF